MKSAGTTEPTAAAAVWRVASNTICSCERNWALVPHVTQFDEADITGTEAARKKFMEVRKGQPGKITMTILAIKAVTKVLAECEEWERSTALPLAQQRIELDLDDGVKVNYLKLGAVLAPIPGLAAADE